MNSPEISIVVPIKNERDNILPQVEEIRAAMAPLGRPYEIVYIDDGSTDDSWAVLTEARKAFRELRALKFDRNHGQSAATFAGIRAARGAIVVTLDGDRQNVPADIPAVLEQLKNADMVCGYRVTRRDSAWRRMQSRVANRVRARLTGDGIRDTGCSLKAFRRTVFDNVWPFNGLHRFMAALARMEGYSVVEAPVQHRARAGGVTKYNFRNRLFRGLADLFAVCWMKRRRLEFRVIEDTLSGAGSVATGDLVEASCENVLPEVQR